MDIFDDTYEGTNLILAKFFWLNNRQKQWFCHLKMADFKAWTLCGRNANFNGQQWQSQLSYPVHWHMCLLFLISNIFLISEKSFRGVYSLLFPLSLPLWWVKESKDPRARRKWKAVGAGGRSDTLSWINSRKIREKKLECRKPYWREFNKYLLKTSLFYSVLDRERSLCHIRRRLSRPM